jgi:hypothetical protein
MCSCRPDKKAQPSLDKRRCNSLPHSFLPSFASVSSSSHAHSGVSDASLLPFAQVHRHWIGKLLRVWRDFGPNVACGDAALHMTSMYVIPRSPLRLRRMITIDYPVNIVITVTQIRNNIVAAQLLQDGDRGLSAIISCRNNLPARPFVSHYLFRPIAWDSRDCD